MVKIFLCLIIILFNDTIALMSISFTDLPKIREWGTKIYHKVEEHRNPDKTKENVAKILEDVGELSYQLDDFESHLHIKLDMILNTMLDDFNAKTNLVMPEAQLSEYIDAVNHFYDNSMKYLVGKPFGMRTLEKFGDSVLWGRYSLPNTLVYIWNLFFPGLHRDISSGFISLNIRYDSQNLPTECDKFVSAQQRMYYIYTQLVMAELKGLVILKQIYTSKRFVESCACNYAAELDGARVDFETRLENYHKIFSHDGAFLSRHVARCHVYSPKIGVDYLELRNFSRIMLFDKNYDVNNACEFCLKNWQLGAISRVTNTTIYDCTVLDISGTFCLADPDSPREYMWWKDKQGVLYGHNTRCTSTKMVRGSDIVRGGSTVYTASNTICNLCMCSVDQNKTINDSESTIWRISVTKQISDIWNDMVVTGVKFVLHDNALHLQIQQTKFSHSAMIYNQNEWKKLELRYYNRQIKRKAKFHYVPLRYNRKMLFLDDIIIPERKAITGVRFKLVGDFAFMLQVHATSYNFATGKLKPSTGIWYDASTQPANQESYKRDRIEIDMGNADDPTRGSDFKYDLESNKCIKFTHTNIHKDGGQTTIPLLDAQPAETQPPFPLSGIGLFFRGEEGYGGFIAARIRTISFPQYMKTHGEKSRSYRGLSRLNGKRSHFHSATDRLLSRKKKMEPTEV